MLPIIEGHIGPLELNQKLSMPQIQELYSRIQRNFKFEHTKMGQFLLCITDFDWNLLSNEESAMLKVLIADTLDILETPDLLIAISHSFTSGFNFILDQIVESFQPNDLLKQEQAQMPLVKIIPKLDKIMKNENQLLQSVQNTDFCSTIMANVFETFCQPMK